MNMSGREKAIASITLVVLLYGVLGLMASSRLEAWRLKRLEYARISSELEQQRKLITQRQLWQKNYAAVRDLMKIFPADKQVDTYWLGVMDDAAAGNKLNILKRQVGGEQLVGDVYELAIDCKDWEGTLDALVHFLYSLESTGVMLDMRQMFIRPNPADHAHLKGSFVLYCAYMRERPAAAAHAAEGGARKPDAGGRKEAGVRKPEAGSRKPAALPSAPPSKNP